MDFMDFVQNQVKEMDEKLQDHLSDFETLQKTYPYHVELSSDDGTIPIFFENRNALQLFSDQLDEMFKNELLVFKKVRLRYEILKGKSPLDLYYPLSAMKIWSVKVAGLYEQNTET